MKRQLLILLLVVAVGCDTKDPSSQKPPANGTTGVPNPDGPGVKPPPEEDPPSRGEEQVEPSHWAYDILYDLTKKGLTRYPATHFRGGMVFTRREMAKTTADVVKAMKANRSIVTETRRAKVLRLIEEFGPELRRLGVSTDLPAAVATPKEAVDTWLAFVKEWDEFEAERRGNAFFLAGADLGHSISLPALTGVPRTRAQAKRDNIKLARAISRVRPTHTIIETKLPEPGRATVLSKKRKGDLERLLEIDLVLREGRWWIQTIRLAGNSTELTLLDVSGERRLVTVPTDFEWTEDRSTPEKAAGGYAELLVRSRAAQTELFVENTRVGIEILRRSCVSTIAKEVDANLKKALDQGAKNAAAYRCQIGPIERIDATHARFKLRTPITRNQVQVERIELVKVKDEWLVERVGTPCTYCRVSGKCGACKGTGVGKSGVACALCLGARDCHRCDGTGYRAR